MHKGTLAVLAICVACSAPALAQDRAGLWESTSTMTWDKVPIPPEMAERMKAMPNNPFAGTTVTVKSCITQDQVDKGFSPQNTPRQCQITNFTTTADGKRADIVCTGQVHGSGSFESHRTGPDSFKVHGHFTGSMGQRGEAEWSISGTTHFLSAACGNIQPGKAEIVK